MVLLSQAEAGLLEEDPEINWQDDGTTSTFTYTGALLGALTGYRSNTHPEDMRGDVSGRGR